MLGSVALAATLLLYTTTAHQDHDNKGSDSWNTIQADAGQVYTTAFTTTTTIKQGSVLSAVVANIQTVTLESETTTTSDETATAAIAAVTASPAELASICAQLTGTNNGIGMGSYMGHGYSEMMVQVVQVGTIDGQLRYMPEKIVAPIGSVVQFQFNPKNHTVSESAFGTPCQPITNTNPQNLTATHPGVFSGFVPVSAIQTNNTLMSDIAIYNVLINSTSPTWIYCAQGTHCMNGMAMVINQADEICGGAPTNKTLDAYKQVAACMSVDTVAGSTVYLTDSNGVCTSTAAAAAPAGIPGYGSAGPGVTSSTTTLTTSVSLVPTVTFTSEATPPPSPPATASSPIAPAPASVFAPSPTVFVPSSTPPSPIVSSFLGAGARPAHGLEVLKVAGMIAVGVGALL